jgi:cysteine desulfurase family protein (TIGR01976 family)
MAAPGATAPVDRIRASFPALARRQGPHPVAYFDGPGGTQVPRSVVEAVSDYLLHHNANTHWAFPTSRETDDLLAGARRTLGDFLHAPAHEVVFGANMTTLTFHTSRALGRAWGPGDAVVVTALDHRANVDPWRELEEERGVEVRMVEMDAASGTLDPVSFHAALGPDVVLVAVCGASNALGTVVDLEAVARACRDVEALLFVDAVHSAAHLLPDVQATGCDLLACSPYKFYGPHAGVLWGREELLERLHVPRLEPAPDSVPERLETGTLGHEAIVGSAAAVDFLADLSPGQGSRRERLQATYRALHHRGQELGSRLVEGLSGIPGISVYGPPARGARTPTVAFTVEGTPPDRVADRLSARWGVFVSHGDVYASTVVDRLGLAHRGGIVRAGVACYTTAEEVDRLLEGVEAVAG